MNKSWSQNTSDDSFDQNLAYKCRSLHLPEKYAYKCQHRAGEFTDFINNYFNK